MRPGGALVKKQVLAQLKLEPPIGRFFTILRPMEPLAAKDPFDSPDYYFQVKWDGVRILAFKEGEAISLQNRKGRSRTAQYPEMQRLSSLIKAREAILDGEIVALEQGKPSFARVIQRDFSKRESSIKTMARTIPCTYCVFDLLYLNGKDLTRLPLAERLQILAESVVTEAPVYLNENFASGTQLYRQIEQQELEGIVAKKKSSPYLFAGKSNLWLKIKPRRSRLCAVGGVTVKDGAVGALLLGAYQDGKLLYLGRAGSGLSRQELVTLRGYASREGVSEPPFLNPPRDKQIVWLAPRLTVVVEYAEWTAALQLRAPVVAGFSNRPPEEAVL
ncbi:MAG: non-homologous end-joining DNA ligase [Bacillota bacterium]